MFEGLYSRGDNAGVLKLLRNMESHGRYRPNAVVCSTIIDNLCKDQLLPHALPLFAEMKTESIPPDVVTYNTFIDMYCKEGMVDEARAIFEHMIKNCQIPIPDIISYSALLDGYGLRGEMDEIENLMNLMVKRTANQSGKVDRALGLLQEMPLKELYPNVVTYNTLIDAWCKDKRLTDGKKLFKEMKDHGLKPNVVTLSSLLDGLCKNAKIVKQWKQ
ncbi:hypothetical protein RDABS01_010933 [Bienertia sinuspersici]